MATGVLEFQIERGTVERMHTFGMMRRPKVWNHSATIR